jgi:hypothetical protein
MVWLPYRLREMEDMPKRLRNLRGPISSGLARCFTGVMSCSIMVVTTVQFNVVGECTSSSVCLYVSSVCVSVCGFVGVNNAEAPFNTFTLWEI